MIANSERTSALLSLRRRYAKECACFARQERANGGFLPGKDTVRYRSARRRLRECDAKLRGFHTKEEWSNLMEACGHRCVRCGFQSDHLTKDHITPISMGGSDAISNLQPMCRECNSTDKYAHGDLRPSAYRR